VSSLAVPEVTNGVEAHLADFFARIDQCKDKTYATHGLHPYPAKFIPHIPKEIIRAYSKPGDLVWDPMCGSGTTLVEAVFEGRDAIGGEAEPPEFPNRDHWFEPQVSRELAYALSRVNSLESDSAKCLARCAFSAILVRVSNQESETRWSAKRQELAPGFVLECLASRLRDSVVRVEAFAERSAGSASAQLEDVRATTVDDQSVQLIVTSPPYANSHDYYLYNKLRMFWLGHDVAPVQEAEIGSRNRHSDRKEGIDTYLDAMELTFEEMHRALVAGGRAVIVVADAIIRKQFFQMDRLLSKCALSVGFERECQFSFAHQRFNSSFQKGFGTRQKKATHVLVFQR
jgi:DNA modification methylase